MDTIDLVTDVLLMNASILVIVAASLAIERMMRRATPGLKAEPDKLPPDKVSIVKAAAVVALESLDSVTEQMTACSDGFRKMVREECLEFFIGRAVAEAAKLEAGRA